MLIIPSQSQENLDHLLTFLDSSQSLRIFQGHELKYGYLDGGLINQLAEADFPSLLTGLIEQQEQWQVYCQSQLLVPEKSVQVSLSIRRLNIELHQGQRSLGQALYGYWQLENFEIPPPTPVQQVLSDQLSVHHDQSSVHSEQLLVHSERSLVTSQQLSVHHDQLSV